MPFTNIFTYVYHQHTQIFVTTLIKNPHVFENMTIWPCGYTKETGWGHTGEPVAASHEILSSPPNMHHHTLILQYIKKQLNPNHASLFYLVPSDIPVDIDI